MNGLCMEAYDFYKKEYAFGLVLFHVGSNYEAYFEDAVCLGKVLKIPAITINDIPVFAFKEKMLERIMSLLIQNKVAVHIIEYRDEDGNFSYPKVKQILNDMEADY